MIIETFNNRKDWLAARALGLGGSEVASVLGMDKYTSPFKVYWRKVMGEADRKPTIPMLRGIALEPLIVDLFSKQMPDYKVEYNPNPSEYTLYIDEEHPWRRGTPDATYLTPDGVPGILECKSTAGDNQHIWYNGVPTKYKIQVAYYMDIAKVNHAYIAYLVDDIFLFSPITPTAEYFNMINNAADTFWLEHVVPKIPPPATTLEDLKHTYLETIQGDIFEADPGFIDALGKFATKKELLAELDTQKKAHTLELEELEKIIRSAFGNREFAMWEGEVVARLQSWGKGRRLTIHNYMPLEEVLKDD